MSLKEMAASSPAGASTSSPRSFKRRAGKGEGRHLQPVRGGSAASPSTFLVKYFAQIGDTWQIVPDIRSMSNSASSPDRRLRPSRRVRPRILPQCADLFQSGDQDPGARSPSRGSSTVTAISCSRAAETVVGLTETFKPIHDRRGLYAPMSPAGRRRRPSFGWWPRRAEIALPHDFNLRCRRISASIESGGAISLDAPFPASCEAHHISARRIVVARPDFCAVHSVGDRHVVSGEARVGLH